jgi:hypothetical protein
MDESLVLIKMLFELDDRDMIVLPSKTSGGYDDGRFQDTCFKVQKAFTAPAVDDSLDTNFTEDNFDYLLYAAVDRSLDLTIDAFGREKVKKKFENTECSRNLQRITVSHRLSFHVLKMEQDKRICLI